MDTEKRPAPIDGKIKKEFLSFENDRGQRTLKDTLKDLGETSSLHGISRIASSRQAVVKVLWCILFLGAFVVFVMQIWQLFKTFYSYPVQTTVSLEFNSIAFPAITLCNMNPVRNNKLNMVPSLQEVLNKGQNPNVLLRKRRETTRKQKMNDKLKYFPTTPLKAEANHAKEFSKEPGVFKSFTKKASDHQETLNKQSHFKEKFSIPEKLSLTEKSLRRRKREASVSTSNFLHTSDYLTVSFDSLQNSEQESLQSVATPSVPYTEFAYSSTSSAEEIVPTSNQFISPSTPTLSDFNYEFSDSFTLNETGYLSNNTTYVSNNSTEGSVSSMSWVSTSSEFFESTSHDLNPNLWYPGSSNTWESWYDYYNNDYHPYFYDSFYNYDNYWYDWYSYGSWNDYNFGGSFFFDQLHSKKDEWDERVENFRTVFKNESVETRKEIGHQKEDMIVTASFAGRVQNVTHFQNFTSTEYGNCFTMASPKYVAWRSGATHGVKLTLNLEIDEYVPNFSTGYGIRIVFHEPGTHPLPSHEGITLSPGTETNIGLRMIRISRLGEPHGTCVDGKEFSERYHKKYSIASCYEFCRIHKTIQDCSCIPVEAPDGVNLHGSTLPVCNSSVKAVKACLLDVDVQFDNGDYSCDCRGPCKETVYAKTMSSTYWPTDDYLEVLISELCDKYQTDYWLNLCSSFEYMPYWELDRFRYNFLRVLVYFEDLNYETITEEPMYESVRFLSDIGGAMGLFLGASLLSFVEVIQLLLELFLYMKEKYSGCNNTRVSSFSAS